MVAVLVKHLDKLKACGPDLAQDVFNIWPTSRLVEGGD